MAAIELRFGIRWWGVAVIVCVTLFALLTGREPKWALVDKVVGKSIYWKK